MLLDTRYASRWPTRLGLLTLLVLAGLAAHFYRERVAYEDLSFHLFTYIAKGGFFIQNRRFVAGITQIVPVLGIWAGLSLDSLMRLYSLAFVVYYGLVFAGCVWWLRNERVALAVVFFFTLLAAHTFYWAQSELPQALAALLFAYAGLSRQLPLRAKVGTYALAALVPVAIIGHPLAVLPFVFLWGYDWLLHRRHRDWGWYAVFGLGLGTYVWRTATIAVGSYEAQRGGVPPLRDLLHAWQQPSARQLSGLLTGNLLLLPLALAFLTVYYLWPTTVGGDRQGRGLRWGWVVAFVGGFAALICASYPEPVANLAYHENLLLPLGLFVAVPLATELLPSLLAGPQWVRRSALGALAFVLLARVVVIAQTHTRYSAYQQWLGRVLAYTHQFPERRFLMAEANADPGHLRAPSWASAFETLLLSARLNPDSARTVFATGELARLWPFSQEPDKFLSPWELYSTTALPARYFRLPADRPYRVLNTAPPAEAAALGPYIEARRGVRLEVKLPKQAWRVGQAQTVEVTLIVPPAARPLHSGTSVPHPTLLRTRFLQNNWPTRIEPQEVPLEVDVFEPWTQQVQVQCPANPARYELEVSLCSKDFANWPVATKVLVEVEK